MRYLLLLLLMGGFLTGIALATDYKDYKLISFEAKLVRKEGSTCTWDLIATVQNTGSVALPKLKNGLLLKGIIAPSYWKDVPALRAGQTVKLVQRVSFSRDCPFSWQAIVDPNNVVAEGNESNNASAWVTPVCP